MPLKTPKTKLEVIPQKNVERDTFQVKTTPSRQIFPEGINKIWLGIPMDPILNVMDRADRELSENIHFNPFWCIVFELWIFVLRHVTTPQNHLYPPPPPPPPLIEIKLLLAGMNARQCDPH